MIAPDEALAIVLENTPRLEAVEVPLIEAVGACLAEPVASDLDLPPFDKSSMDGYAVRAGDVAETPADLTVIEELPAGVVPTKEVGPGQCAKIMTGAPVPAGADMVVMVEDTERAGEGRVRILAVTPDKRNVCLRGEDIREGQTVLDAGHVVRAAEVGLLASVGRDRVRIHRRPRVAVLGTGDELVPITETPGPGRIRDSNSWSLTACCRRAGVEVQRLGVAKDTEDDLREKIGAGLACDVLLVSGGVSMGEWDLVPKVFGEFGVTVHFATVRMKPGKPTVFATAENGIIFGLPGNPVSTLVAWRLFVWPALRKMMGHRDPSPPPVQGTLTAALKARGNRTTFVPVRLKQKDGAWTIEPVTTHGSADMVSFTRANALAILEPGTYGAGATVPAVPLEL